MKPTVRQHEQLNVLLQDYINGDYTTEEVINSIVHYLSITTPSAEGMDAEEITHLYDLAIAEINRNAKYEGWIEDFSEYQKEYIAKFLEDFATTYAAPLLSEIDRLKAEVDDRWISVDERLPEPQSDVLVWDKMYEGHVVAYYNVQERFWCLKEDKDLTSYVTRWQPLPKPPAQ